MLQTYIFTFPKKKIVSGHLNGETPTTENLGNLIRDLQSTGADVVKLLVDVSYITAAAPIFQMLTHCQVHSIR